MVQQIGILPCLNVVKSYLLTDLTWNCIRWNELFIKTQKIGNIIWNDFIISSSAK